jgi:hypothetical protein
VKPIDLSDVQAALDAAVARGDDIRLNGEPVSPTTRLPPPSRGEAISALEAAEYRAFAASLGIPDDGEPPDGFVRISKAELDALRAEAAKLRSFSSRIRSRLRRKRRISVSSLTLEG